MQRPGLIPGRNADPGQESAGCRIVDIDLVGELGPVLELEPQIEALPAFHEAAVGHAPEPVPLLVHQQNETGDGLPAPLRRHEETAAVGVTVGVGLRRRRRDGDPHLGTGPLAAPVGDRVDEGVLPREAGIGGVGQGAVAVDGEPPVGGKAQALELEGIAVGIAVVGERIQGHRGFEGGGDDIVAGRRRAVGPLDADRHHDRRGAAATVPERAGEAVLADEAGIGEVGQGPVAVDHEATGGGQPHSLEREGIAVGILGRRPRIEHDGGVDRGHEGQGPAHRRRVAALDADRHRGRRRGAAPVGDGVGKPVRSLESLLGPVGQAPVGIDGDAAVGGGSDGHELHRVTVGIAVVGEHVDGDGGGTGGGLVVGGKRRVVGRQHGDGDLTDGRRPVGVADRVGETVDTGEAGCRRVGEALVGIEDQGAVRGQGVAVDRETRAAVVGQDREGHGGPGGGDDDVGSGGGQGCSP